MSLSAADIRCSLTLLLAIVGCSSACVQMRRLMLSETVVSAIRPLAQVAKVASVKSCAQLCLRESNCAAARYRSATKQCDLLTARPDGLEGAAALAAVSGDVEVWAIVGRGLGECPPSFTASYRSSRYRLAMEKAKWPEAERICREQGGKLAELTSQEEVSAVASQLGTSKSQYIYVGGAQETGAEEPAGGWRWYRSQLPISSAIWYRLEPNDRLGIAKIVWALLRSNDFKLGDGGGKDKRHFMCECHSLP